MSDSFSTGTLHPLHRYGSDANGFSQVSPLRFAKKRTNPKNQRIPGIHRRELWERFGKGVDNSLYISTCLCISADQRVFHQGAEEALPEEQRHRRLLFHLELCYDHSKSDCTSPTPPTVSGHQHVAQPTLSAFPGSACFNHSVVSSLAPVFG